MPGYATWRTLYHDEYRQLREEGYAVGDKLKADMDSEFLPFPAAVRAAMSESEIGEADWETAYHNLWRVREQGLRPDYPYVEPDGYDAIIADGRTRAPTGDPVRRRVCRPHPWGVVWPLRRRCAGQAAGDGLRPDHDPQVPGERGRLSARRLGARTVGSTRHHAAHRLPAVDARQRPLHAAGRRHPLQRAGAAAGRTERARLPPARRGHAAAPGSADLLALGRPSPDVLAPGARQEPPGLGEGPGDDYRRADRRNAHHAQPLARVDRRPAQGRCLGLHHARPTAAGGTLRRPLRQHGPGQERDLRRHVRLRLRQRRTEPQPGRAYDPGRRPVGDPAALAAGGGRAQRERLVCGDAGLDRHLRAHRGALRAPGLRRPGQQPGDGGAGAAARRPGLRTDHHDRRDGGHGRGLQRGHRRQHLRGRDRLHVPAAALDRAAQRHGEDGGRRLWPGHNLRAGGTHGGPARKAVRQPSAGRASQRIRKLVPVLATLDDDRHLARQPRQLLGAGIGHDGDLQLLDAARHEAAVLEDRRSRGGRAACR